MKQLSLSFKQMTSTTKGFSRADQQILQTLLQLANVRLQLFASLQEIREKEEHRLQTIQFILRLVTCNQLKQVLHQVCRDLPRLMEFEKANVYLSLG